MTAPARLEAVVASFHNRMNSEHGETLVMGPPSEQVIEKMYFHQTLHCYVTTPLNVTSVVRSVILLLKFGMKNRRGVTDRTLWKMTVGKGFSDPPSFNLLMFHTQQTLM